MTKWQVWPPSGFFIPVLDLLTFFFSFFFGLGLQLAATPTSNITRCHQGAAFRMFASVACSAPCLNYTIWVLPVPTAFIVRGVTNMKPRELSLGNKTSNCEAERRWKINQSCCTNIGRRQYNHLGCVEEERSHWCTTGRARKTAAVKKDPKRSVSDISNNLQRAGVKVSQSTAGRRLHEQKYRGCTRRCKPLINKEKRKARLEFAPQRKGQRRASAILGQSLTD